MTTTTIDYTQIDTMVPVKSDFAIALSDGSIAVTGYVARVNGVEFGICHRPIGWTISHLPTGRLVRTRKHACPTLKHATADLPALAAACLDPANADRLAAIPTINPPLTEHQISTGKRKLVNKIRRAFAAEGRRCELPEGGGWPECVLARRFGVPESVVDAICAAELAA